MQLVDRELKYKAVTFRKSGDARFIAEAEISSGWNRVQEVPVGIDINSVSVLDPNSTVRLIEKAFRSYDDLLEPTLPTEVEVLANAVAYRGLLVKKTPASISLIASGKLIEITSPYVLSYSNCPQDRCQSIIPRISLFFSLPNNSSNKVDLTFEAGGFSWNAAYKAFIDFDNFEIFRLMAEISCRNDTNLALMNVEASFLAKSDENNNYPRAMMAAQRSTEFSSQQTASGSAIYRLQELITIPEKSTSSFKFFELEHLDALIESHFNILQRPRHPITTVKFEVPDVLVDGIPSGEVECWDGTTWLTDAYVPMAGPQEYVTLNLGENAFIKIQVNYTVNQLEEKQNDGLVITRSVYEVSVSIQNNSKRNAVIDAYHALDREIKDLKLRINTVKYAIVDDDLGKRLKFTPPAIEPRHMFTFYYTLAA